MTSVLYETVTSGNATLIAIDGAGKQINGGPRIACERGHWNDGHPAGALLEKEYPFDAMRLTAPMRIAGWKVLDSTRQVVGSFMMSAPVLIEPGTMVKLSRTVLVPRVVFEV